MLQYTKFEQHDLKFLARKCVGNMELEAVSLFWKIKPWQKSIYQLIFVDVITVLFLGYHAILTSVYISCHFSIGYFFICSCSLKKVNILSKYMLRTLSLEKLSSKKFTLCSIPGFFIFVLFCRPGLENFLWGCWTLFHLSR